MLAGIITGYLFIWGLLPCILPSAGTAESFQNCFCACFVENSKFVKISDAQESLILGQGVSSSNYGGQNANAADGENQGGGVLGAMPNFIRRTDNNNDSPPPKTSKNDGKYVPFGGSGVRLGGTDLT